MNLMIRRVLAATVSLLPLAACGVDSKEEQPTSPEVKVAAEHRLSPLSTGEVVDPDGKVWTVIGPVQTDKAPTSVTMPSIDAASQSTTPMPTDPEKLAELLRPMRIQNGVQYILRDPPIELARAILAMKSPPKTEPNEGSGGPIAATTSSINTKYIMYGDDRSFRTSTTYPERAVGRFDNGCSASFVGSRTIITAAHCFWDNVHGVPTSPGYFRPATNDGIDWWGHWSIYTYYWPSAFVNTTYQADWDFAVADLTIDPNYTGSPGWFGTENGYYSNALMLSYPGDKVNELWLSPTIGCFATIGARYKHTLDILPGSSGAPMYHLTGSTPYTIGIQTTQMWSGSPPPDGVNCSYSGSCWNEVRKWDSTTWFFVRDYSIAW